MTAITQMTALTADQSHVFVREIDRPYPLIASGRGAWLQDVGGMSYLDGVSGGAMVTALGHGVDEIIDAGAKQARSVSFLYSQQFTSHEQEKLAERLAHLAPEGFGRAHFVAGGAEANETALRVARAYHVERGEPDRWRIISPAQSYHGPTMSTLALTGRPAMQRPFEPYLERNLHIPPSTWRFDPTGAEALEALDLALAEAGSETVAAFFIEPVSAAALPGYSPPREFWLGLDARRREHGFLICLDEVVTGMGRTGAWFAALDLPLVPDVITVAKGLGAGYVPIGAMLCSDEVYAAFEAGSRAFELGHTWGGAPLQCAVANAVIDVLERENLIEHVAERGRQLRSELEEALSGSPLVREVRGRGFLLGVDYVDPSDGESMLDPSLNVAKAIDEEALARGLIVYSTQPTADGFACDQTLVAPPFVSTEADLAELVTRFAATVKAVEGRLEA